MRKKFLTLLFVPLLMGCNGGQNEQEQEVIKEVSYSDYSDHQISWKDCFYQAEPSYFIYVYSETCHYCKSIKEEIFAYVDSDFYPFYFVNYSKEVPVFNDVSCTIGATKVDNLWIGGTPTLIHIINKVVFANLAGAEKILAYLEMFQCSYDNLLYDFM